MVRRKMKVFRTRFNSNVLRKKFSMKLAKTWAHQTPEKK